MSACRHTCRMSAFHDGEASEAEGRELREHVQHCAECAAELDRLDAISRFFAASDLPSLSGDALRRLHRQVSVASERIVYRAARAFAMCAAGVLVFCLVGLWLAEGAPDALAYTAPAWERTAVLRQVEPAEGVNAEAQFVQWIVEDLSRENGSD